MNCTQQKLHCEPSLRRRRVVISFKTDVISQFAFVSSRHFATPIQSPANREKKILFIKSWIADYKILSN